MNEPKYLEDKSQKKGILYNNKFIIALSLVLSVALWLYVAISFSGDTTRVLSSVPVHINIQDSSVEKLNLSIVNPQDIKVDVTIRGNRFAVGRIVPSDITVTAQLTSVVGAGNALLPLKAQFTGATAGISIVSISQSAISVQFDRMITKDFKLEMDMTDIKVADGFVMETPYFDDDTIIVDGPENTVNKIGKIIAKPDIDTSQPLSKSIAADVSLVVLNKEGTEIAVTTLTMNVSATKVNFPVLKKKTLPITVGFLNVPGRYAETPIAHTISTQTIDIAGPAETVDAIEVFEVGKINFADIKGGNNAFKFDIKLPTGVKNLNSTVTSVDVTVNVPDSNTKTFTIEDFQVVNIPQGQNVSVVTTVIKDVVFVGSRNDIRTLVQGSVIAEVDMTGRDTAKGQYEADVKIYDSRGLCWSSGSYKVFISIE